MLLPGRPCNVIRYNIPNGDVGLSLRLHRSSYPLHRGRLLTGIKMPPVRPVLNGALKEQVKAQQRPRIRRFLSEE
jgi:hypothetical protein